jgi:hypothetical protein
VLLETQLTLGFASLSESTVKSIISVPQASRIADRDRDLKRDALRTGPDADVGQGECAAGPATGVRARYVWCCIATGRLHPVVACARLRMVCQSVYWST